MNLKLQLENILFLDIETVPQYESWNDASEMHQTLFEQKTAYQRKDEKTDIKIYFSFMYY